MAINLIKKFIQQESSSSFVLFICAILSLLWVNSPIGHWHQALLNHSLFWINEGLMTLFFLLVGMELKQGYVSGYLVGKQMALPAMAALGGMLVPALVYLLINHQYPHTQRGWATPVATDIAFALAALGVFGRRVPNDLKLFLMALAIFDDIGAILIIALFYTASPQLLPIVISVVLIIFLVLFNYLQINRLSAYLAVGAGLWLSFLPTGIHPTIAGVILACFMPATLLQFKEQLHPWVAFAIMPLFALANAGFLIQDITIASLTDTVTLGILAGLVIGKPVGVFGSSYALIRLGWANLPKNCTYWHLFAVAILCGIGFTMSLFLGTLSFQNEASYLTEVRLGVISGSIFSAIIGLIILNKACSR